MNSHAATQEEMFDNFIASPAKAPAPLGFGDYLRLSREIGPLIPQNLLPGALSLSKQRVSQLIQARRFETCCCAGQTFVTARSFEAFLAEERKSGRPVKDPGVKHLAKVAVGAIRETVAKVKSQRKARRKS